MIHAYPGSAVRVAEKPLLDAGQGDSLMRRAAWGLATHVLRKLRARGPAAGSTVAALRGTGNNGGTRMPARTALLIDGVLGTGARRGWDAAAIPELPSGVNVVACGLPSGVDADTGQVAGGVIPADATVTFGALKTGLIVGAGAHAAGRVELVDIGLGPYLSAPHVSSLERHDALAVFAPPAWDDHKYSRGVLGVAAGSEQYPGAAVLVCSAGLASGAGMVHYAGPAAVRDHVLAALPEVVAATDTQGKARAWVAGSGMGSGDEARSRLAEVIETCGASALPLVLDDSALDLVTREDLDRLRAAGAPVVLTPHHGELLRMAGRLASDFGLVQNNISFNATRDIIRGIHSAP